MSGVRGDIEGSGFRKCSGFSKLGVPFLRGPYTTDSENLKPGG